MLCLDHFAEKSEPFFMRLAFFKLSLGI